MKTNTTTRAVTIAACAVLALAQVGVPGAMAQQAPSGCTYLSPIAGARAVGSIVKAEGNVLVSSADGPSVAVAGAPLALGSRVIVGAKSSASLRVGDKTVAAPANTTVKISARGSRTCVQVSRASESFGGGDDITRGHPIAPVTHTVPVWPIITGLGIVGLGVGLGVGLSGKKKRSN